MDIFCGGLDVADAQQSNDSARRMREAIDKYMWISEGNGTASVMERIRITEGRLDMLEAIHNEEKKSHDNKMNQILGGVIALIVLVTGSMILFELHLK